MRRTLLLCAVSVASLFADDNLIDRILFEKMKRDGVTAAPLSTDAEFLRRVYLDVTGRLPEPEVTRAFLADTSAGKRQKAIDALFPPLPVSGMRSISQAPFLDRWTYFFADLFRNGQLLEEGINTFHDYIYKTLTLNIPYDEFVREMITARTVSTWTDGSANFIARSHVFEGDGYRINHEDTADEVAINTTKLFLGVNLECVSCHDGAHHLEKVNLWLSQRKRVEVWRQANFFGRTRIEPVFGRSPQFLVKDTAKGYDLTTMSAIRPRRDPKADITPQFLLGGKPEPGENLREAYARMITTHPQFARATVNLIWTELMGVGFIESPFDFDLARQDPANPPPAPWTVQPNQPELLEALAEDFRTHNHDLRRLIRMIVSSRIYQLSSQTPPGWKEHHESYFARRTVRRMSAEQIWDAVSQVTGVFPTFQVSFSPKKVTYVMQTRSPQDLDRTNRNFYKLVQQFGQCDRYTAEADRRGSMVQSAILLNHKLLRERVKRQKDSRIEKWLAGEDSQLVDDLFTIALSRPPTAEETAVARAALAANREEGAEDLVWATINRLDFLFY